MKKLNVLSLLALCSAFGCQFSEKQELPEMQDALLWKISGNEMTQPSYLFGTFNGVAGSFLDSVPGLKTAFANTKQVVVEVDLMNVSSENQKSAFDQALLSAQGMGDSSDVQMPADTTYKMLYRPDDYAFVDSELSTLLPDYQKLKPKALVHQFLLSMKALQQPVEGNSLLDLAIMKQVKSASIKVIALETLKENMDYKMKIPEYLPTNGGGLKDQALGLLLLLKVKPVFMNVPQKMAAMYQQQSLSELYIPINDGVEDINEVIAAYPDFGKKSECKDNAKKQLESYLGYKVNQRNDKWMTKILYAMKKSPTLISVGALHLIGVNGLINKLREYGYTVEPVLSEGE